MSSHAREIVLECIEAINTEDFARARQYVSQNMSFVGVLGTRNGADAYFSDMERLRLKYEIKKVFAEGDDVCLIYDLTISGQKILCVGWYQVEGGKIQHLRVVFDPRPLLEAKRKQ
jgi:hypothetical protein